MYCKVTVLVLYYLICVSTHSYIQHIKAEKYRQFGFSLQLLNPIHWFQFADMMMLWLLLVKSRKINISLIDSLSGVNGPTWLLELINVAHLASKMFYQNLPSTCMPKLLINKDLIPTIKTGESFEYLERHFDFNMTNEKHKSKLISLVDELMSEIDLKPLHPKNKILLYSRYVLSKLSWHFTVATISQTWVVENIDSPVNKYIRKWLEVPISGTLSSVFLTRNKFGLNILPASVKFIQCQTVLRNALKASPNDSINELWKSTNRLIILTFRYDSYNSTKEVLKTFHSQQENKLRNRLRCQGSFFENVSKFSLS